MFTKKRNPQGYQVRKTRVQDPMSYFAQNGLQVTPQGDPPKGKIVALGPNGEIMYVDDPETYIHPEVDYAGEFVGSAAERIARQMFMESGGEKNPDTAVSPAGARGRWQIMPGTQADLEQRGLIPEGLDPFNPQHSKQMRDAKIGALMDLDMISNRDIPEENKLARIYASYNYGEGNLRKFLNRMREQGVDIEGDPREWIQYLPKETRDYINYIEYGIDKPR